MLEQKHTALDSVITGWNNLEKSTSELSQLRTEYDNKCWVLPCSCLCVRHSDPSTCEGEEILVFGRQDVIYVR